MGGPDDRYLVVCITVSYLSTWTIALNAACWLVCLGPTATNATILITDCMNTNVFSGKPFS